MRQAEEAKMTTAESLWINIPFAVLFIALWAGIPMWMIFKHPDRHPRETRTLPGYLRRRPIAGPPAQRREPARAGAERREPVLASRSR
jgi:hypothetical protein